MERKWVNELYALTCQDLDEHHIVLPNRVLALFSAQTLKHIPRVIACSELPRLSYHCCGATCSRPYSNYSRPAGTNVPSPKGHARTSASTAEYARSPRFASMASSCSPKGNRGSRTRSPTARNGVARSPTRSSNLESQPAAAPFLTGERQNQWDIVGTTPNSCDWSHMRLRIDHL